MKGAINIIQKIYLLENREPEKWETLTCDPTVKPLYQISTYGRIKNDKNAILKCDRDKDGYVKFTLQGIDGKKKRRISHRLVAMQFIKNDDPINKIEVNHIGVEEVSPGVYVCHHDDNYYKNLEWCTHRENIRHSQKNNLQIVQYGEDSKHNKFDVDTVVFICIMMENGFTNKEILKMFGFTSTNHPDYNKYRGLIKHIRKRNSWNFVTKNFKY